MIFYTKNFSPYNEPLVYDWQSAVKTDALLVNQSQVQQSDTILWSEILRKFAIKLQNLLQYNFEILSIRFILPVVLLK